MQKGEVEKRRITEESNKKEGIKNNKFMFVFVSHYLFAITYNMYSTGRKFYTRGAPSLGFSLLSYDFQNFCIM